MLPTTLEEIANYIVADGKGIQLLMKAQELLKKDLSQLMLNLLKKIEENIEKCYSDLLQ